MRMELRQKRRVIEEVAVYDSRTFYENQSPKRSRQRVDRSHSPPAAVHVEPPAGTLEHVTPTMIRVQPEPTPSTSAQTEQPSRTFAVTGSVQVPADIEKLNAVEEAPGVVTCVATVMQYPHGVTQDSGGERTSVTYVVHHTMPGKMAVGDFSIRSNDGPYRDLRTDLAETPSLDYRKKGKMASGDYGPVLETVTYVVCYQVAGQDDVINELNRPNYTITGRVGPTSSLEDTAESYTLTGLSGGPPPYSEEQESLYMAILNYAARSQDNWQREVPGSVTYITQQDFQKAIDSNTLSLTRKGPTIETNESSPPPTPTPPDDEIWVKQKVVVVEPAPVQAELATTTADVFSEAMDIVEQDDVDVKPSPPTVMPTYRGWRRDDEIEVKKPVADVVKPRYKVEIRAEISPDDKKEPSLSTEASQDVEVVETTYLPDEPLPKASTQIAYHAAAEMPEVSRFPETTVSTTRTYMFHEQAPTIDVVPSGSQPLTSKVDVTTSPVAAYVKVTAAGSDTISRTYVVHREWPSLQPPVLAAHRGTLAEALAADSAVDVVTTTYVVSYDWPTITKPAPAFETEMVKESREVELRAPSPREDVPQMVVVRQRESPPRTTARYDVAVPAEMDIGISTDAGPETLTVESPEQCIAHVYIVRRDWPSLKFPQPEVGRDIAVRLGSPSDIGPAPTGDMTRNTYVVHRDWPAIKADLPLRQPPVTDVVSVPTPPIVTEAGEVAVTAAATAAAPPAEEVSYTVRHDGPVINVTSAGAIVPPKPRVTFAPTVMETDVDLIPPSPDDVAPHITYEVNYDLRPEKTIQTTAAAAAAVEVEQPVVRVPEISVTAAGAEEGRCWLETAHDSSLERDWPWFKRDSPALRQTTITVPHPEEPLPVTVEISPGVDYRMGGFRVDTSTEVPSRELTSKTYIVHRDWPELMLEVPSRRLPDSGLAGTLLSDVNRGDITSRTYVVHYEWPPVERKPTIKDDITDAAVDSSASSSAEDAGEMSPTYLARIERSRVKIHLPGPDRSREAEVEVIPPEPEEEPSPPPPSGDNVVSHTYIVYHDWPPGGLLLSEPKSEITDEDLFTSLQTDTVTYIVHCDRPSRKAKKHANVAPETFTVEPPDNDISGTDNEFIANDIELPAVSVVRPPEPRGVEFEQRAVEVVTTREPQVRLRYETDIDEVTGSGVDDFKVQYDLPPAKFQPELEPIHVREPAIAVVAREPEVDRRLRLETDIDFPIAEPAVVAAADIDVPPPVTVIQARRAEDTEPTSITIPAPSGEADTHTYIVHHDWPRVKLTLPEPKRRLEVGPEDEADRQLTQRTYVVHYDWPTLKIKVPAAEQPTRIVLQEPESGEEVVLPSQPVPSVVFHYDVPDVEIEEPEPVRIREPSVEVIAARGDDVTDVEVGAAVAAPAVTYVHAEHEPRVIVSGEATPSGELTSHTYIVHHTWPRVKLKLSEPKSIMAVSGGIGADTGSESVPGTLERKSYVVHYDWPTRRTLPQREVTEPEPSTIEVCPMPRPTLVAESSDEPVPTLEDVGKDEYIGPAAVTVIAPSGDVVTHTYIVHHDWPKVKLVLSEPKRRLDIGLHAESGDETDREIVSRTYVVHYDWPSLKVKAAQPTVPPERAVIESREGKPMYAETDIDVAATATEPVPSILIQQEVPEVKVQEPEPITIPVPFVEAVEQPEPEVDIRLRYETDVDLAVAQPAAPPPSIVVEHKVPEVKIHEPEPVEIPEPSVRVIEEPEPEIDLRLRYETDIDVAVAEPSSPPAAAAAVPVAVTYVDEREDEHIKPAISVIAPSGDVDVHTYIVHHYWPRVKLTLSEPKRRLEVGADNEADRQLTQRTYIVHHDWPTLRIKVPASEQPTRIVLQEPESREEVAIPSQPGPSVVFRYDVPEVEVEEPEPVRIREPSVEVIAARGDDVTDVEVVTAVAEPAVTYVHAEHEPHVIVSGEATPSGELTSHTYIVHHTWPRVKLKLSEPKSIMAVSGGIGADTGSESVPGTLERKSYVVHHDWPSIRSKLAAVSPPREMIIAPEPPTSEVKLRDEPAPIREAVGKDEDVGPAAVTVIAPSGDVVTHTYIVHHDWPKVKLILSEPKRRLDIGLHAESDVETDRVIVSRTYIVHYDWPKLKVEAMQLTVPSARVVIEQPESREEPVHAGTDIDVVATVTEPVPSVLIQQDVSLPEVKVQEPEPMEIPEPSVQVVVEPEPEIDLRLRYETDIDVAIAEPAASPPSIVVEHEVPEVKIHEPEPIEITEPEVDMKVRYETDIDLAIAEPAAPPAAAAAVPVAVTYVDEHKDEHIEPAISIIAPSGDVDIHTYIVHHDWPKVKLILSQPKRRLDIGLHAESDVETDREIVSRTYIVHYDWPSLKVKAIQQAEPSARVVIEQREIDEEVQIRGEPLPGVLIHHELPEVKVQEPEPIEISEPFVEAIEEPEPEVDRRLRYETDIDVAIVEPAAPPPSIVVEHDVPEVRIHEPEPVEIPEPEVDLKVRYETDIDVAVAEPAVPPAAAVAVPVAVTYVDEGEGELVEPTIAIVAPSEDTIAHTYIVHHDWPKVKLTLSEPRSKLGISELAEDEGKVISVTYVVNWPSVIGKPGQKDEIQEQPTVPAPEPASIEVRVGEEPRPSADIHVEAEPAVPEVEVEAAVITPDVAAAAVAVADEEKVVVSPIVTVAAGDTVSHTYIVHHDWPKVKLVAPVPKRPIAAAAGDADVDKISITYIVHYDWPAIQRPSIPEPSAGAAIQAIDSGTDVSGEVEVGVAKPASDKVTHTFIVHYDWPTGKAKLVEQPPAGEETEVVDVSVEKPEITQPSPPEISLEIGRLEEPVLIETVVVGAPDVEEPEPKVPAGEVAWELPETDVTVKRQTFDIVPHVEIEAEPPHPLVTEATADLPPTTTVVETKLVEPPVTGETLTLVVGPEPAAVELEAAKGEEVPTKVVKKEPQEDLGPETITYIITYEVSKKEAGKPPEVAVKLERRRSSVEEVPGAEVKRPEVEVPEGEAGVDERPSAEISVVTPAESKKVEAPGEETVKYVVEYHIEVVKGRFSRLFMKKVSKVPAPETLKAPPAPPAEEGAGTAAEDHGIPVQRQLSETVNVDYDAVLITPPAVILQGGVEEPEVVLPSPYVERPEVEVAAAVAASVAPEPSAPSEGDRVTYIVNYDLPDVGIARLKKPEPSLTEKDKEPMPEQAELAVTGPEAVEVPTPVEQPGVEVVSPPTVLAAVEVQPSPGLEKEVRIRGPDEVVLPKISADKDVLVAQPSPEVELPGDVEVVGLPSVEGVESVEKTVPPARVSVELEQPELDISIRPSDVDIPKTAAAEVRVGPAPEVEVEVPAVETVQEAAAPPETDTVTYIVHYEEPMKPSTDEVRLSFRRKRRAGADEIRILLRPLSGIIAADDVTFASDVKSVRHHVVVAIDIGTTFSGYAFTLAGKTDGKDKPEEDAEQSQQQQQPQQQEEQQKQQQSLAVSFTCMYYLH